MRKPSRDTLLAWAYPASLPIYIAIQIAISYTQHALEQRKAAKCPKNPNPATAGDNSAKPDTPTSAKAAATTSQSTKPTDPTAPQNH